MKIFSQALAKNNNIEEIGLGVINLGAHRLSILLENLNQRDNVKSLGLSNTHITLAGEVGDRFVEFIKNTDLKELDIARNPIECKDSIKLLTAIREKNTINVLNMDGLNLDDSAVDVIAALISKDSNITEIGASLGHISSDSGNKLLAAVQNNKTVIGCMIFDQNEGKMSDEDKEIDQKLTEIAKYNYQMYMKDKDNHSEIIGNVEELN